MQRISLSKGAYLNVSFLRNDLQKIFLYYLTSLYFFIVLLFIFQSQLQADLLYLRNGKVLEGIIKKHNIESIEFENEEGEIHTIHKSKIQRVQFQKFIRKTKEPEPNLIPEYIPIIFEVTRDNRLYTIPIFGKNFPSFIQVKLVSERGEKFQKYRNLSEESFVLIVDPEGMELGIYDLVIFDEQGKEIQKYQNLVQIVDP